MEEKEAQVNYVLIPFEWNINTGYTQGIKFFPVIILTRFYSWTRINIFESNRVKKTLI